jgi:amino acid transporter
MFKYFFFAVSLVAIFPSRASAVVTDIFGVQVLMYQLINRLAALAWAALFAFFVFGVVKYIKNADDSAEREKGRQFMLWAIICFTVLVSIWAIVTWLLSDTLGITVGGTPTFIED